MMSKKLQGKWIVLLSAICLLLIVGFTATGRTAYADSLVSVSFVSSPEAENEAVYGEEVELVLELEEGFVGSYFWYRSETPTSVAVLAKSGASKTPSVTVKDVSESGYYHCEVTSVMKNNNSYALDPVLVSDTFSVVISPKTVRVEAEDDTFTYNGARQTPTLVVNAEDVVDDDEVNAYLDLEVAPKNAGTYTGSIRLDNDNYQTAEGSDTCSFVIEKAPLTIRIQETSVRAGRDYTLEILYEGLQYGDTSEDLGFTPTIPDEFRSLKTGGTYVVHATGKDETDNYLITYAESNLYVDVWRLEESDIMGVRADAGGTFRPGTKMEVTFDTVTPSSFSFFKTFYCKYTLKFTEGGADAETFLFNLKDDSIVSFCLAACLVDEEGNAQRLDGYTLKDGVLSVKLPAGKESVSFMVYYDYTLLISIIAIIVVVLFIMFIALMASRRKFKRHKFYYTYAQKMADKARKEQRW